MTQSPTIFFVLILLLISICSPARPLVASENPTLDGNVYAATHNGEDDLLTFRDGSFQSSLFAGRGFQKGEYTITTKGNQIWFKSRIVDSHEGEILWTGIIEGDAINGSYLYTKKGWFIFGDTTKMKNFKGSLKAK